MKLFYNYNFIGRIYLQITGTFIIHPYINLTLANVTYYLFNSNSEPYGFVQRCKIKEQILCPRKISFKGKEKKDKLFLLKHKGKTNQSYLGQRPKPFQSTKHELRKNTKRKKISELSY